MTMMATTRVAVAGWGIPPGCRRAHTESEVLKVETACAVDRLK